MIARELLMDLRAEIRKIAREEVKKAIEDERRTAMSNRTVFIIACVIYSILFFCLGWTAKVVTV